SVQDSFTNSIFYVQTLGTLALEHRLLPTLTAALRVTGGTDHYPTKTTVGGKTQFREDTIGEWGGRLRSQIRPWLWVSLDYRHTLRDSNFKEFRFADDKLTLTITLQL